MPELPTGTVTFMFTDIQGSTRLLEELGSDRYRKVQGDHDAIIREAIAQGGGVVVRTEGDSFFVAFPTPSGAVRAAVAAQRDLAAHPWPEAPVRVRMGLHTGEGELGGDDYLGMDVNRAARIGAAGHGGQVLVSAATRALVHYSLPDGVELRDLGEHRLKDISHPERLHDLVIAGLPADFPPLRTLGLRPNNLPVQLTSFIGRVKEIEEVRQLLSQSRLLTITGPGGAGKTRLALQVAAEMVDDFEDGVFFADLSAITDPTLVPSAIAGALGIVDMSGRSTLDTLEEQLREKKLLLVADNFEQVAGAAPVVEQLVGAAPALKVLVTSRLPLAVRGEQEYEIPPLERPAVEQFPDLPRLCRLEAVRLFLERARAVRPEFAVTDANASAVAEITARLDGLPLAIELAATKTKLLTAQQVLARLGEGLGMLSSKVQTLPERQRTLRGAIAWSYDLLNPAERLLFARLSVFNGGWSLESAEAVCGPEELGLDPLEGLASLVNNSLVVRTETAEGETRFYMLLTIKEYAAEQLAAQGELDLMRQRHSRHYLEMAREAEPYLTRDRRWLDRCDREHANLRAALRFAIEAGEVEEAQATAGALWRFWGLRGYLTEGQRWFTEVLALPGGEARTAARAKALAGAGGIAWWQANMEAVEEFYEEALSIERERGDPGGIAEAMFNHAHVAMAHGDLDSASEEFEESLELFQQAGDELGVARIRSLLAAKF
ncbi:MAG TPA: adenylate/guanylate cyclase domain-containing protein, partial [Acidimicrobiia bacterium]|nr:adenylate/guanylate cyclase domain-containing protein [Acidimicrobiia bacterium]